MTQFRIIDGDPAINVKDGTLWARDPRVARFYRELSEQTIERCYEEARTNFWEVTAPWAAVAHDFKGGDIWSAGHSGGWLALSGTDFLDCTIAESEATIPADWTPSYEPWRHGGWYVIGVRYPSGAVGCVSRNYADRKWRIVCEGTGPGVEGDRTFANRDEAARAEYKLARYGPGPFPIPTPRGAYVVTDKDGSVVGAYTDGSEPASQAGLAARSAEEHAEKIGGEVDDCTDQLAAISERDRFLRFAEAIEQAVEAAGEEFIYRLGEEYADLEDRRESCLVRSNN